MNPFKGVAMAEINNKVMTMVEEELRKDPAISTRDLFQKAVKIDKAISGLSPRQFNALYPLQVKRRLAPKKPRGAAASRARRRAVDRSAVRAVLLHFAMDIAAAEDTADVIEVIGNVDQYVEKVVAASGGR
jgi:hypothetical protein